MNKNLFKNILVGFLLVLPLFISCNRPEPQSYIQTDDGFKSINGTEIYYKRMGQGEPIVIVHGGPVLEHGYLVPYLKPLANNFELIFFDQRLSGRSSANVDSSDVRLEKFIDDIEELRKALKLDKIHLMAHSWGGLLAMSYALKYPSNLNSLELLNSMPASSDLWSEEEQILAQNISKEDSTKRQDLINSDLFKNDKPKAIEELLRLSFRNQFYNPSLADSLDFFIPDDYSIRSQRFGNIMVDIANYDLHPRLSSLRIPTLLIYGEIEPAVSLSGAKLDNTVPNSKLIVFKKSGHFPFVEQQDQFIKEVQAFLKAN